MTMILSNKLKIIYNKSFLNNNKKMMMMMKKIKNKNNKKMKLMMIKFGLNLTGNFSLLFSLTKTTKNVNA